MNLEVMNLRERGKLFIEQKYGDDAVCDDTVEFARAELLRVADWVHEHIECKDPGCAECTMAEAIERHLRAQAECEPRSVQGAAVRPATPEVPLTQAQRIQLNNAVDESQGRLTAAPAAPAAAARLRGDIDAILRVSTGELDRGTPEQRLEYIAETCRIALMPITGKFER